ncbi:lipoxygenase [Xylariaceae sp. FL1651]|nr:lipoxygenase [Xylariaceae sp. FL1651]
MKFTLTSLLLAGAAVQAAPSLTERSLESTSNNDPFSITSTDRNPKARAAAIDVKRKGWLYGHIPFGVAVYPTGTLANKTLAEHAATWQPYVTDLQNIITEETAAAIKAVIEKGNFTTLDDYYKIYEGQWQSSLPSGPLPGMLTNYTDDRTFSMMRLSTVPYRIRRVQRNDKLLFPVDNAAEITGLTLEELHAEGRLFSVDFSDLNELEQTPAFGAGCQAFFYIDPKSGDFLPLAVKPIVKGRESTALVYTPKDNPNDWLLAKMLINQNDGWHSTWGHTTKSHSAAEAPYLAAIRTLSDSHPVLAIMNRVEKTPWQVRPHLQESLVLGKADTGPKYYPWTADAARTWANQVYSTGETAKFYSNYYLVDLKNRGLIDYPYGPALKSFPYYEDAGYITERIREFMATFINSYYPNDKAVAQDKEIQAWLRETDVAEVYDFPPSIQNRQTLIDILTHQAYLGGVLHTIMSTNGNQLDIMALPFAPAGFPKEIPTEKGIEDIMPWMPTPEGAGWQVATYAAGNRAAWKGTNQTISYMFDDADMLQRMNHETRAAAAKFQAQMFNFSAYVQTRTFDKNGLDRGMPYVWNVLDPNWGIYWSVV